MCKRHNGAGIPCLWQEVSVCPPCVGEPVDRCPLMCPVGSPAVLCQSPEAILPTAMGQRALPGAGPEERGIPGAGDTPRGQRAPLSPSGDTCAAPADPGWQAVGRCLGLPAFPLGCSPQHQPQLARLLPFCYLRRRLCSTCRNVRWWWNPGAPVLPVGPLLPAACPPRPHPFHLSFLGLSYQMDISCVT